MKKTKEVTKDETSVTLAEHDLCWAYTSCQVIGCNSLCKVLTKHFTWG